MQGRSRRSGRSGHGLTTFSATKFFLLFFATRGEIFSLKFTKYRSAAGLRLDLLGELKRCPRLPSRNKGGLLLRGGEGKWGEGKRRERRGKHLLAGPLFKSRLRLCNVSCIVIALSVGWLSYTLLFLLDRLKNFVLYRTLCCACSVLYLFVNC